VALVEAAATFAVIKATAEVDAFPTSVEHSKGTAQSQQRKDTVHLSSEQGEDGTD